MSESLVNSNPVDFSLGTISLNGVDYNETRNYGYPSSFLNSFNEDNMKPFCPKAKKTVYNFRQKTS